MTKVEFDPLRFKLLYFFVFGGMGVLAPYVPVFFERLMMSKVQIGVLLMIPSLSSFFFAPLWSLLCDRLDIRSEVMFFALIVSQILTCSMYLFDAFFSMSLIVIAGSVVKAPLTSLLDSLVIDSLVDKTSYGSLRLWGAVAFAITSFLGGAIIKAFDGSDGGVRPFLYVFSLHGLFGALAGVIILSITMRTRVIKADNVKAVLVAASVDLGKLEDEGKDSFSGKECSGDIEMQNRSETLPIDSNWQIEEGGEGEKCGGDDGSKSITRCVWGVLSKDPSVGIFLLVVFCSGLGSGVIDAFLFIRLKQLGGSGLVMGVSRAITCLAEVPCFQIAGTLQKRMGTWRLLALTQLAFFIRFTYYSFLTVPWAVLPCEVLHGFTFAVMWSTACTYADEIAPKHVHSTIQAIVESIHWGLGSGLGALLGGLAYSAVGAVPLFEASAVMSLFSMLLALLASVLYGAPPSSGGDLAFSSVPSVPVDSDDGDCTEEDGDKGQHKAVTFNPLSPIKGSIGGNLGGSIGGSRIPVGDGGGAVRAESVGSAYAPLSLESERNID